MIDETHLKQWIGRSETRTEVIAPFPSNALAATLDRDDPEYADGTSLPPLYHWLHFLPVFALKDAGYDGHAALGGFLPPVPLPRRMWAGGEVETLAPLRIGDRVVRRETVSDVAVKAGRTGTLCFVTVRHDYETERGLAIRDRQDIVYREASRPGDAAPPPKPAPAEDAAAWSVEADPVLLFRYSAMTFNGHRFHYDHPYATQVEGYAGLVVHGPMQASLLLNLAAARLGRVPARFRYRGVAPMIAGSRFAVAGRREGEAFRAWTAVGGTVHMEAEAEG